MMAKISLVVTGYLFVGLMVCIVSLFTGQAQKQISEFAIEYRLPYHYSVLVYSFNTIIFGGYYLIGATAKRLFVFFFGFRKSGG